MKDRWVLPKGWKVRALRGLEALIPRIAALKGRVYNGFGFHHEMVQEAEYLKNQIPKVGEVVGTSLAEKELQAQVAEAIIAKVRYEMLIKDVAEAEASAEEWTRTHPGWK